MAAKRCVKYLRCAAAAVLLVACGSSRAYAYILRGSVTDRHGEPLIGAIVAPENAPQRHTTADFDGYFVVNVPDGQEPVVRVACLGYTSARVKVDVDNPVNIRLDREDTPLGQLALVGAGQQKSALMVSTLAQSAGGLHPFDGSVCVARGADCETCGVSPLVIVDGEVRDIDRVDFSEITAMSVLKEVSAKALYGSSAAGGAIVITTRSAGSEFADTKEADDGSDETADPTAPQHTDSEAVETEAADLRADAKEEGEAELAPSVAAPDDYMAGLQSETRTDLAHEYTFTIYSGNGTANLRHGPPGCYAGDCVPSRL